MYLSKLTLNPRLKQVRRDISNPYEMHATLMRAVDGRDDERLLWRLEQAPREAVLLVQSRTSPDWPALFDQHPDYAELDTASPKRFEPTLAADQVLRFRLRANPTVTRFDPEQGKRKRHGLVTIEDQLGWLHRQGERNGFTVLGAMVSHAERMQARKNHAGDMTGRIITVQSVTYDGHLRICEPDMFLKALRRGLGHAKALGFGLLSVGPAR